MKIAFKNWFLLAALLVGFGLALMGHTQTFTTLHNFSKKSYNVTNSDGAFPVGVILSSSTLYGTANQGGSDSSGTIFKINTDGSEFAVLYTFTNSSAANPRGRLLQADKTLYGAAGCCYGSVFAINTQTADFQILASLPGFFGGMSPNTPLILSGPTLYGTSFGARASPGYPEDSGTVFEVNTNGTGYKDLYIFSDGAHPQAGLLLSDGVLYGTAAEGGWSNGTIFRLNIDGTAFKVLHTFTASTSNAWGYYTNMDGATPMAGLVLSGDSLYGTASRGGISGLGTLFRIQTDGTGFTNLHNFTVGFPYSGPNDDGIFPTALILSGTSLYGVAEGGGSWSSGTLFKINTDGSGFQTLYSFSASGMDSSVGYTNADGFIPQDLVLSGNTFYGVASEGGSGGSGTVFSISFAPQLAMISSGANVILTWPTNYAGFDYSGFALQSTTNLTSPVWTTNSVASVIINGQYTVSNLISGAQQFFRLSR